MPTVWEKIAVDDCYSPPMLESVPSKACPSCYYAEAGDPAKAVRPAVGENPGREAWVRLGDWGLRGTDGPAA